MQQEIKINSNEFKPLNDYLLVKVDNFDEFEKSNGGILIYNQKSCLQRPGSGIAISCGGNCKEIEDGDYVVFPSTDGIDIKFNDSDDDNKFLLLRYASVIGKKQMKKE